MGYSTTQWGTLILKASKYVLISENMWQQLDRGPIFIGQFCGWSWVDGGHVHTDLRAMLCVVVILFRLWLSWGFDNISTGYECTVHSLQSLCLI